MLDGDDKDVDPEILMLYDCIINLARLTKVQDHCIWARRLAAFLALDLEDTLAHIGTTWMLTRDCNHCSGDCQAKQNISI